MCVEIYFFVLTDFDVFMASSYHGNLVVTMQPLTLFLLKSNLKKKSSSSNLPWKFYILSTSANVSSFYNYIWRFYHF